MHLIRIEMKGFKSFADKTVIDFEKGVTAVVGPNGSGKSNITEALRWVLGETSAKSLRGGKMPDIIFAGSENRKPLNIAEVTVVLDNSDKYFDMDFTEISVTRRISRSGESEYFINKKASRLKDIQDLFMDSGLGKESFSIISQGKVEAIFNSKPEDRRGIFEEAAGVLKYKTRKKEAERKLFETEDNLNRLQDILFELEEQLDPLKEQSDVAKVYTELSEELREKDIALTANEILSNKEIYDVKKEEYRIKHAESEEKNRRIVSLETTLASKRVTRSELQQKIDSMQSQLVQLTEAHTTALGEKNVLAERSKHQEKTASELEEKLANVEQKLKLISNEIDTIAEELNQVDEDLSDYEEEKEELQGEVEQLNKSSKEISDEIRAKILEQTQKEASIQQDLKHLEEQYVLHSENNEQKIAEYESIKESIREAKRVQDEFEEIAKEKSERVEKTVQEFQEQARVVEAKKQEKEERQSALFTQMNEISKVQARLKSLKEIRENYQGYYQGVKAILKTRETRKGIIGTVAECFTVPSELALAIETALGSATQNIIVENEESAKEAISYLSKEKLGRATFYPLTTIKPRSINDAQRKSFDALNGFVGVASELVTSEDKLTAIKDNLLGQVLIAKDLHTATQIARTIRFQYRVVSLDGAVMNQGGSMTGGASKHGNRSTLLSQNQEIEELEKTLEPLKTQQLSLENALKEVEARLQEEQEKLDTFREKGEQLRLDELQSKNEVEAKEVLLAGLIQEKIKFEEATKELSEFLSDFEERENLSKEDLKEVTENILSLRKELEEVEEKAVEQQSLREEKLNEMHQLTTKIELSKERLNVLTMQLKEKSATQKEFHHQKFEWTTLLKNMKDSTNTHVLSEEENEKRIQDLKERKDTLEVQLVEEKQTLESLHATVGEMDDQLGTLNKESQQMLNEESKIEMDMNRASMALDHLLDYLQEEYELTFEAVKDKGELVEEKSLVKTQVKSLKKEIENLGPVNIAAIEQYAQVSERYEFLSGQQKDLLDAKASIFNTMEEMDEIVATRFKETFDAIRKHFTKVFPSMFGGGRADLILTDPFDLLNTGVEIEAQPPGKKMQSLSLLSGGERALTAIALLFSIIQVRPVPFCVLDEVEAALDEANVSRFGQYLANFEDETQFIVVTHRKGTMENANVLYGVTMQESGVSRIVSVRLEEVQEDGKIETTV